MTPHGLTVPSTCICGKPECEIPFGLCHCGCGKQVTVAVKTSKASGLLKGRPIRFLHGHSRHRDDGCPNPQRRRFRKLKALGLCAICGKNRVTDRILCGSCRVQRKKREYREFIKPCKTCRKPLENKVASFCKEHRTKTCKQCLISFVSKNGAVNSVYCSRKCRGLSQRGRYGELACNWQGGKVAEKRVIRGRKDYKEWRDNVYKRDNWTCQHCGNRQAKGNTVVLHAHHIKEFSKYPELRIVVSNGLTLCEACHGDLHIKQREVKKIGNMDTRQHKSEGHRIS